VRIFVTGGNGLVGRHTIRQLRARGDEVLALARSDEAARALDALGASVHRGNLGDAAALERGVAACDATVHAAAMVMDRAGWDAYRAGNVAPTEAIATAAAHHGKRLVHISSVAVYGRRNTYAGGPGSVTEDFGLDHPPFPGDHYARSKREAELALWRVADTTGLKAAALRPCVIYGEGDRQFSPRVAWALRIGGGFAPLPGGGASTLSVVYAGNVAAAVLAALDRPAATGPFLITNDGAITLRGFLESFASGLGVRLNPVKVPAGLAWTGACALDGVVRLVRPWGPMTMVKGAVQFLSSDNPYTSERAERVLGWRPIVPPVEAVERTGRAFRRADARAP
jgi:nucleoside-diphosphate-sugar epimerase